MTSYCPTCQATVKLADERCPACQGPRPELGFPQDSRIGRLVAGGQYRVLRRIGAGGFGIVYEVETMVGRLRRALKVLNKRWEEDSHVKEQFINEALVLEQVNHPNIARCFAAGRLDDGDLYLLFELVDGLQLSQLLKPTASGGRVVLEPMRALRIARQVAAGLKAVHDAHFLHRDLKPDNILISNPGEPREQAKVVDFGIAKFTNKGSTSTQNIVGTPEFMPPEQFLPGTSLDARVDIWQLGATIFSMLTGQAPYAYAGSIASIMAHQQARRERGPMPSEVRPELAEFAALDEWVANMLASDPNLRPQSAALVCEQLALLEHRLVNAVSTASRVPLLTALCATPCESAWTALHLSLCSMEHSRDAGIDTVEGLLSSWPESLRVAPGGLWEQCRRGEVDPLWRISRSLDLSYRGLRDADIVELAGNAALASITHLDLSNNQIGNRGLAALSRSPYLRGLTELELGNNLITSVGLVELPKAVFASTLRSLSLADNGIGVQGAQALASSGLRLECLDLGGTLLGTAGGAALAKLGLPGMQSLRLASCGLGAEGVAAILASESLPSLRELDVSHNDIGIAGAESLARHRGLGTLSKLRLAGNGLGPDATETLLRSASLRQLRSLDLSGNALQAAGAMQLARAPILQGLLELDISDNELGDLGLAALMGSPYIPGLRRLGLARNSLTGEGCRCLKYVPAQLEELELTHNPIGGENGVGLAQALTGLSVERLRVGGCNLDGFEIAQVLEARPLRELDVSRNSLTGEGAAALADAVGAASLVALELRHCHLGSEGVSRLASSAHLRSLQRLDLSSNALGNPGIESLAEAAQALPSLELLILEDNGLDARSAELLASSTVSRRLHTLSLAHNRIGDLGAEALSRGQQWHVLRHLNVRRSGLSLAGAAAITTAPGLAMLQRLLLSDNALSSTVDLYGLGVAKVELLESTFARVRSMGADFAAQFYDELFARYPSVRPLFAKTDMNRQRTHLMGTLSLVIDNLRNPESLESTVSDLGSRHVGYGVAPGHYLAVTHTLLDVLARVYGDEWTQELHQAWSYALDAIVNAMLGAPRLSHTQHFGAIAPTALQRPGEGSVGS